MRKENPFAPALGSVGSGLRGENQESWKHRDSEGTREGRSAGGGKGRRKTENRKGIEPGLMRNLALGGVVSS